jgi:hydrogenase maturation protease
LNNVAVVGLGNFALKDEGAGMHALRFLKENHPALPVDLIEGATAGLGLFDLIKRYQKVIFLDAVNMGKEPGSIGCFSADQLVATQKSFSLHEIGLAEVLKLGQELGEDFKAVKIFGIQPRVIAYGESLSESVEAKIPALVAEVVKEVENGIS